MIVAVEVVRVGKYLVSGMNKFEINFGGFLLFSKLYYGDFISNFE